MFKKNPADIQMNLIDPYHNFPKYIKEALHNSWAEYFYSYIFSKINEERFAVLFSDNYSRPNTPVNMLIGLLILKELNHWIDEEMMGAFYFDYRVQYALGITDFDKERFCINTVGNFRSRLYEYAKTKGCDLLREEVDILTEELIKISKMDTSLARQDSFMISANCKMMGRLELIYTVNLNMVKVLKKKPSFIPEACSHYLEEKDKSTHIYRIKKEEVTKKIEQLLHESLILYDAVPESLQQTQAFLNLTRLLEEQTQRTDDGRVARDKSDIASTSLQNPSEPDATYRKKGKKQSTGYVMNTVEARDEKKKMSMIVHHDLQPNVVSDTELYTKALDSNLKGVKTMVSDGSFYATDVVNMAFSKGVEVSFSALCGRKSPEGKLGADTFNVNPDTNIITCCPGGAKPFSVEYNADKKVFTARFDKKDCAACDLLHNCIFKERKTFNLISFTEKKLVTDIYRNLLGTKKHQELGDFRAGVEGVPSVLRRAYSIDHLPVRGLIRSRTWDNCKIMAYNFKSFFNYFKRIGLSPCSLYFFICWFRRHLSSIRAKSCYGW